MHRRLNPSEKLDVQAGKLVQNCLTIKIGHRRRPRGKEETIKLDCQTATVEGFGSNGGYKRELAFLLLNLSSLCPFSLGNKPLTENIIASFRLLEPINDIEIDVPRKGSSDIISEGDAVSLATISLNAVQGGISKPSQMLFLNFIMEFSI